MAGWFKLSLFLILLTLGLDAKKDQRKLKVVIDTFYVKHHDPDLFEELKCVVTQANRSYLSCNMILRRSIDQAEMITNFDIIKANNQTMKLYNNRMDFCQYFTALHKNFNYTLTDWYMAEKHVPNYLPESLNIGRLLSNN
ncbi:uncharacterized protein LOC6578083 [Drosophila mojavensis]|uniref:uncharacterized protein LOC6578083 n=1 Tax=Drosophila mojavensis TaxID=7230 RepID=UPI0013EEBABE|nr:uncharacterized protein LOC6578083 [Drosophila mojavensis]